MGCMKEKVAHHTQRGVKNGVSIIRFHLKPTLHYIFLVFFSGLVFPQKLRAAEEVRGISWLACPRHFLLHFLLGLLDGVVLLEEQQQFCHIVLLCKRSNLYILANKGRSRCIYVVLGCIGGSGSGGGQCLSLKSSLQPVYLQRVRSGASEEHLSTEEIYGQICSVSVHIYVSQAQIAVEEEVLVSSLRERTGFHFHSEAGTCQATDTAYPKHQRIRRPK